MRTAREKGGALELMDDVQTASRRAHGVTVDLVEYVIITVPDARSVPVVVSALGELVADAVVRVLDAVVVERDELGGVSFVELSELEDGLPVRDLLGTVGAILSEHDLLLASVAVRPGAAAVVIVEEDRWAERLSLAAGSVGGRIAGGERIPSARVASALAAIGIEG